MALPALRVFTSATGRSESLNEMFLWATRSVERASFHSHMGLSNTVMSQKLLVLSIWLTNPKILIWQHAEEEILLKLVCKYSEMSDFEIKNLYFTVIQKYKVFLVFCMGYDIKNYNCPVNFHTNLSRKKSDEM